MPQLCLKYASTMPHCLNYAPSMPRFNRNFILINMSTMPQLCQNYTTTMPQLCLALVCPNYAPTMPVVPTMPQLCPSFAPTMPQLCLNYAPTMTASFSKSPLQVVYRNFGGIFVEVQKKLYEIITFNFLIFKCPIQCLKGSGDEYS